MSPTIEKYVEREAKVRGFKPSQMVEDVLKAYRASHRKPREPVSDARRQLRELLKHKKKTLDFDAAIHAARPYARKLEADNAELIEMASKRFAPRRDDETK